MKAMALDILYNANGRPHDRYVVVGTSGSGKTTLADRLTWRREVRRGRSYAWSSENGAT